MRTLLYVCLFFLTMVQESAYSATFNFDNPSLKKERLVKIADYSFTLNGVGDDKLLAMLDEAMALNQKRMYKSAIDLALKIQNLARTSNEDIIYIKAVEIELLARQWFGFENFHEAIQRIDEHIESSFERTEILLRTFKIVGYANYYRNNKHEFDKKIDDGVINELPVQWSKNDFLKLIEKEVNRMVQIDTDDLLTESEIKMISRFDSFDGLFPANLIDRALLTAIESIGLFDGDYQLVDQLFYVRKPQFVGSFRKTTELHPLLLKAKYYALLLERQSKENLVLNYWFDLQRLKDLFDNDVQYTKLVGFEGALQKHMRLSSSTTTIAARWLADIYKGYAQKYFAQGKENMAAQWQNKAIQLCEEAMETYPKSDGVAGCKTVIQTIKQPSVGFESKQSILPNHSFTIDVSYKNQQWIKVSAYRISTLDYLEYLSNNTEWEIIGSKLVWQETIQLPNSVGVFPRSATAVLPALNLGHYVLVAEPEKPVQGARSPQIFISSTNLSAITQPQDNNTLVFVDNFDNGFPVKGFDATLIERKYDRNTRLPYFENNETINGRNGRLNLDKSVRAGFMRIVSNGDTLITRFSHNYIRETNPREHQQVRLFTDRSIYRPGQWVHFKGVSAKEMDGDFAPNSNVNLSVSLVDSDYKTMEEQQLVTNSFGSFWGIFKIPESARPGRMQVKTNGGAVYFDVQNYKRPLFDAEWMPSDKLVRPGEEVSLKLAVKSFAGQSLKNANVETSIKISSGIFRHFHFFKDETVLETLKGKTDQNGIATITFTSSSDNFTQHYTISSVVTTPDGSMREFTYIYYVSPKPMVIEFVNQGHIQSVDATPIVNIQGINGEQVAENISIRIKQLDVPTEYFYHISTEKTDTLLSDQASWKKLFPGAAWQDALNFESLSKGKEIYSKVSAGKDLKVLDGLTLKEGVYAFEFWTSDTLYSTIYQLFTDVNQKKMTLPEPFSLTVDKNAAKPGDAVLMTLSSRFKESSVKLFVTDKDGIIYDKNVILKSKKLTIPIEVKSRSEGKISIQAYLVHSGQLFEIRENIDVKPISRVIDVEFVSIRDCIAPGDNEVWKLKFTQDEKAIANAEVLAAMYDMSLDEFIPHQWQVPFRLSAYGNYFMRAMNHNISRAVANSGRSGVYDYTVDWSVQTPFDYVMPLRSSYVRTMADGKADNVEQVIALDEEIDEVVENKNDVKSQAVRTNFNETAFFYPTLKTSEEGIVALKFTAPEAMSRWKLQILAHNEQMAAGYAVHEVVTKKPLMIIPNKLRFVHQGDMVTVLSTAFNASDSVIKVQPDAKVTNPVTGELFDVQLSEQSLTINPGQSKVFSVSFYIPENVSVIQYLVTGKSGKYTDGELHQIPAFPAKQHIVNSMALWNKPHATQKYKFEPLSLPVSKTSSNHQLSIEMTTNPLWFAIKAMPAVYETSVKSAVKLAQNFYVTAKTNYIMQQYPQIQNVLKVWKNGQPNALQSEFNKNEDLKNILIGQTPWQMVAEKEELQRAVLLEMMNPNFVNRNIQMAIADLEAQQLSDGAFSWRPGMRASWYFTLQTAHLLSQTMHLSGAEETKVRQVVSKAVQYLDSEVEFRYKNMLRHNIDTTQYVTPTDVLKYFQTKLNIDNRFKPNSAAQRFFMNHSTQYKKMGLQQLVFSGIVNMQVGNEEYATLVVERLRQRAVIDKENGIYWRENQHGWQWDDAPIVTQSLIIQFFHQMNQPVTDIEAMKIWLIRQKQGQAWLQAESSLAAIDALLTDGQKWIDNKEPVVITVGNLTVNSEDEMQEAGTGYFRKDIGTPALGMDKVVVQNNGATPVWGAVYYSYTEAFEAIKPWQDELTVKRELFVIELTEKGEELRKIDDNTALKKGSRVQVRLSLRNKRNLEFVALTSPHAACFEPANQLSGYNWSNGLLYYKESHDSEFRFFFDNLKKGDAVITYDLYVERTGTYSAGAAEIQSVYAPEFGANSAGYRINVEK